MLVRVVRCFWCRNSGAVVVINIMVVRLEVAIML